MDRKISNNEYGVVSYSISDIGDLEQINKEGIAPTSTAILVDETGMRIFMLNGDRTKWVEL